MDYTLIMTTSSEIKLYFNIYKKYMFKNFMYCLFLGCFVLFCSFKEIQQNVYFAI